MGTTYLVYDQVVGANVALKLLHVDSPDLLAALRSEFSTLSGLIHPNLCQVHDFGWTPAEDGASRHFYTSDYIDGVSLDRYARGRPWTEVCPAIVDALGAAGFLHALRIRHGDLKPENVLVDGAGKGTLIDLGCSRPFDWTPESTIAGTPGLIAPELLRGEKADQRADLYSLGKTLTMLFESLAGEPPTEVVRLVSRLVSDDPRDRPSDAQEMVEALGSADRLIESVGPPDGHAIRLVGRSFELDVFDEMLSKLLSREEGVRALFLTGPEGIGRSRLLREMKWRAQMCCQVIEGSAGGTLPVTSILRRALDDPSLAPGLSSVLRVGEQLGTSRSPQVLVLDDVHQLDDGQREVLDALMRTLEPTAPWLVLCAGTDAPAMGGAARVLELSPLSEAAVFEWARGVVSETRLGDLIRLTGGVASAVHTVLARLWRGEVTEDELAGALGTGPLSRRRISSIEAFERAEQRALALVAVMEGPVAASELEAFGVSSKDLVRLLQRSWIERGPLGVQLVRAGEAEAIAAAVDERLVAELRDALVVRLRAAIDGGQLEAPVESDLRGRVAALLVATGHADEARAMLLGAGDDYRAWPQAWRRAAELLVEQLGDPEVLLAAAQIHEAAGHPERALSLLSSALGGASGPLDAALHQQIGTCYLKQGDAPRALEHLNRSLELEDDIGLRARTADLLSRAHAMRGEHAEALRMAMDALGWVDDVDVEADLHDDVGVSASYVGDLETAREHLQRAAQLHEQAGHPRRLARSWSYEALVEYRRGDAVSAAEGYRRALEIADEHGLADEIATAALNLGTACHQLGNWGQALDSYRRGLPVASAIGKVSTEATLRFDLAKLFADIGMVDRAETMADHAATLARSAGMRFLEAAVTAVRAEIEMVRGNAAGAVRALREARETFSREGAARELAELDLQLTEVRLSVRALDEAEALLISTREKVKVLGAEDLIVRAELLRGRLLMAREQSAEAATVLESALDMARNLGQMIVEAEVETALGEAYDAQGASFLVHRHRSRAREVLERIAAPLPDHLREVFWRHPRCSSLMDLSIESTNDRGSVSSRERNLERLLEVYGRLNSSLKAAKVLNNSLDAAIELTGAERGFLILAEEPGHGGEERDLQVVVARNLDRERVGRSHLKFSQGIAEQVIATGTPVITVDAQSDQRFSGLASVHSMQLKSIISVPIRTAAGVLGAIYLDNRFQRGRFERDDLDLLVAFADQVGIALTNARLHNELQRRTRELEAERARVDELLKGQAREIDRLVEQVRTKQDVLEHRYDYSNIIGRSPAMEEVLSILDRVICSPATVLIQGESGTGKELIARTIHYNGPRRQGPFVTINCGALPETLLEAELFGHRRGAFTGADRDRDGLLVSARGGSVLLDELGEMPAGMQVKLLRVLEQREVRPLGASQTIPIDIRLICATNRRLHEEVEAGRFREDLFYRLGVVEVFLPPLRDRLEDIPELVHYILAKVAERHGRPPPQLSRAATRTLLGFSWPGNVRQLENVLTRALLLAEGEHIASVDLPVKARRPLSRRAATRKEYHHDEIEQILAALRANRWNVTKVSTLLGIPRATLYRKIKQFGLRDEH